MKKEENQEFLCPVCNVELSKQFGNQVHPNDPAFGITLFCNSKECPAQEVAGHTTRKIEREAYQIIIDKFIKRK